MAEVNVLDKQQMPVHLALSETKGECTLNIFVQMRTLIITKKKIQKYRKEAVSSPTMKKST